jgi:hypothetical protein
MKEALTHKILGLGGWQSIKIFIALLNLVHFSVYSQTGVQWLPSGPGICGRCWQVVVVQR